MRVASYQLRDEIAGDVIDRPPLVGVGFLGQPGVERDLEQDVAELLAQGDAVLVLDRLKRLVGLL